MNEYKIKFDCTNGKSYESTVTGDSEQEAMTIFFANKITIICFGNVIHGINTSNVIYAEIIKG